MPSITVKDIPADLYERFKNVAQKDRRSLNLEIRLAMDRLVQ